MSQAGERRRPFSRTKYPREASLQDFRSFVETIVPPALEYFSADRFRIDGIKGRLDRGLPLSGPLAGPGAVKQDRRAFQRYPFPLAVAGRECIGPALVVDDMNHM